MINQRDVTPEWLTQKAKQHNGADKILIEKVIRAFLLLEGIVKVNIPFIFKGGTSLMLLFDTPKRLSIDIDVILEKKPEMFEEQLTRVAREQGFFKWEKQQRNTNSKIVKEHYRFFYEPLHRTLQTEEYILLDVLYEKSPYNRLISLPIQSPFVPNKGLPLSVTVPSHEDLLGDKLTAFAPHTTGIPYQKNGVSMSMEIIKQLYDIGNLFETVTDLELITSTFRRIANLELNYRGLTHISINEVLEDIYNTSLCLITRGKDGKGDFEILQKGVRRAAGYIFSESYHVEKAVKHASRAAYLAVLIQNSIAALEKYHSPIQIENQLITVPGSSKLNKLRKSDPESFYYWYKIVEIIRSSSGRKKPKGN